MAPGEVAGIVVAVVAESDTANRVVSGAGCDSVERREIPDVVDHLDVAVDGRCLGDVADPAAQGWGTCGMPGTLTVPDATIWVPTMARMNVVLPHPEGPSRPVIVPRGIRTTMSSNASRFPGSP